MRCGMGYNDSNNLYLGQKKEEKANRIITRWIIILFSDLLKNSTVLRSL